jgi:hypothetical protein
MSCTPRGWECAAVSSRHGLPLGSKERRVSVRIGARLSIYLSVCPRVSARVGAFLSGSPSCV